MSCMIQCRNFSIVAFVLIITLFFQPAYSVGFTCNTCQFTYIMLTFEPSVALTNKINVTAHLYYITVPSVSDPEKYMADIQSGKIDVKQLSKYVPTGTLAGENLTIWYQQNIGGDLLESPKCVQVTNVSGGVRCEIEIGSQGCGSIYAFYNASENYFNSTASVPYCAKYVIPFGILLGPECFTIIIFIGLLIAGMYAVGKNPMSAFEIVKPKAKTTPPTYPIFKYKRYPTTGYGGKWQLEKVAGGLTKKLAYANKGQLITSLAKKLGKVGILSAGIAGSIKKLPPNEMTASLLSNPELLNRMNQIKKVQLVSEQKIATLSARLKTTSGFEKEAVSASLKKAKEDQAKAQESLAIFGRIQKTHLNMLKSYIKAFRKGQTGPPDQVSKLMLKGYTEILKQKNVSPDIKINALNETLSKISKQVDSNSELIDQKLFLPVARAKLLSEEAVNSAIYLLHKNKDKLAEKGKLEDFEKYFGTNATELQFKILKAAIAEHPAENNEYKLLLEKLQNRPKGKENMIDYEQRKIQEKIQEIGVVLAALKNSDYDFEKYIKKETDKIDNKYDKLINKEKDQGKINDFNSKKNEEKQVIQDALKTIRIKDADSIIKETKEKYEAEAENEKKLARKAKGTEIIDHYMKAEQYEAIYKQKKEEINEYTDSLENSIKERRKRFEKMLKGKYETTPEQEQYSETLDFINRLPAEIREEITKRMEDEEKGIRKKLVPLMKEIGQETAADELSYMIEQYDNLKRLEREVVASSEDIAEKRNRAFKRTFYDVIQLRSIGKEYFDFLSDLNREQENLQPKLLALYQISADLSAKSAEFAKTTDISFSAAIEKPGDAEKKCLSNIVELQKYSRSGIILAIEIEELAKKRAEAEKRSSTKETEVEETSL